ncbi:uncharacterized protein LOC120084587 [Benincasa hispida]|uniref:uncharacterized protein LOC120084587 n=1 Tax=Benincasa hispida TaxID=102211 RepID=UPI0018FF960E|nr:uncharacterized protein LOC120084587 [Benincasa hispida]
MSIARFEVEKFDGKGDFGLWKAKIKAILDQQKAHRALLNPSTLSATMTAQEKEDWELATYDQETAYRIWTKLEELYATKDLPSKMYLSEKFFTFKMDSSKTLTNNFDEFKKIVAEFKTLGEKLSDKNEAYVLPNSLPESYKEIKNALKYGRDSRSTYTIISALRTRELELQIDRKNHPNGEGMLDAIRCEYRGKGGTLEVLKDTKVILLGKKINDLFVVK